jgi:hypothetical protein
MTYIVERIRLRPSVQFFQPLSRLIAARFANRAMFTVWAVDSQEEQPGAHPTSLIRDPPHGIQVNSPQGLLRLEWRELIFEAGDVLCDTIGVSFQ